MPDTRPLRIAQKILVEFTVCQLEDGAPITLEQMRHVVKSLPSGGNDWRDNYLTVKQVSSGVFSTVEIGRARLVSIEPAAPCVSVTDWPFTIA